MDIENGKLGKKNLKIYSKPFAIEDLDINVKTTYNSKEEFDNVISAYNTAFECDIDSSEFNTNINS